jgi:hypothetical protein
MSLSEFTKSLDSKGPELPSGPRRYDSLLFLLFLRPIESASEICISFRSYIQAGISPALILLIVVGLYQSTAATV